MVRSQSLLLGECITARAWSVAADSVIWVSPTASHERAPGRSHHYPIVGLTGRVRVARHVGFGLIVAVANSLAVFQKGWCCDGALPLLEKRLVLPTGDVPIQEQARVRMIKVN